MKDRNPRKINVSYESTCKNCNGEGGSSLVCSLCAGTGYVLIEKEIYILISPSPGKPLKFNKPS